MSRVFHPVAWIAWTGSALAIAQTITNPVLQIVAIAALAFTAIAMAADLAPVRMMLIVGGAAVVIRVVLFGLAGHPGGSTLLTIPQVHLPALLGGFTLGGAITGEVLATAAVEGLQLATVLACFGVLLSVVEPARILRLVPRFLFEAGLVVAIGAAFVPSLIRTAREVRDGQRLRGYRGRGLRAASAFALPILAGTLDRAMTIAESMESRGYGRTRGEHAAGESRARLIAFAGLAACSGGALAVAMGASFGWVAAGIGTALLIVGCMRLTRFSTRTRYRRERMRAHDAVMIVVAAGDAIAALLLRGRVQYAAWPVVHAPRVPVEGVLVVAVIAAPVLIAGVRSARLRAVSAASEVPA